MNLSIQCVVKKTLTKIRVGVIALKTYDEIIKI